jgi:hypothetical protein
MLVVVLVMCAAALLSPILVDARHWWPRKREGKEK